jgi:hypothetical protein
VAIHGTLAPLLRCKRGSGADLTPLGLNGDFIMFWHDWARKDLQRGDLNALRELKRGWGVPSPPRLERLWDREFIEEFDGGKLRITMKGRVALLLGRR